MLHKHCDYGIIIHVNNGGIGEVVNTSVCGSDTRGFDSHIPPFIIGLWPSGKATGFDPVMRWFESS
jgi:hypothetical protein